MKEAEIQDRLAKQRQEMQERQREDEYRRLMLLKYDQEKKREEIELEERRLKDLQHKNEVLTIDQLTPG